jgi:hypothetical protein
VAEAAALAGEDDDAHELDAGRGRRVCGLMTGCKTLFVGVVGWNEGDIYFCVLVLFRHLSVLPHKCRCVSILLGVVHLKV